MAEFETTIEVTIKVTYSHDPGQQESWGRNGGDPPIPAHIEDMKVIYPATLDKGTLEQLEEECMEDHRENLESDKLDAKGL